MGKVLLCTGNYAQAPYFLEKVYVNIYSAEELCYCLMQSTFLLDHQIMDAELADWIGRECGLQDLSDQLMKMIKKECSLGEFAGAILTYVGYASQIEIDKTKELFEKGMALGIYERKKQRADFFLESKKYVLGIKYYNILLGELPDAEILLRAKILHNIGTAYACLFQFKDAAESFLQAYSYDKKEDTYFNYLFASRMGMEEMEYISFLAEKKEHYEVSMQVEKYYGEAVSQFESTKIKKCKGGANQVSYYEETDAIIGELKEQYREIAAE